MWGYLSKAVKAVQETVGFEEDTDDRNDDRFQDTVESEEEAQQLLRDRMNKASSSPQQVGGAAASSATSAREIKERVQSAGTKWIGSVKGWVKAVQHDIGLHTADASRQIILELDSCDFGRLSPEDVFIYFTDIVDRVEDYSGGVVAEAVAYRDAEMSVEQAVMASEDMRRCYDRWDWGVNKPLTRLHELIVKKRGGSLSTPSWDTGTPMTEESHALWSTLQKRIVAVRDESVETFMEFLDYTTCAQDADVAGLVRLDAKRHENKARALEAAVATAERHRHHHDPAGASSCTFGTTRNESAIGAFVQEELHGRTVITAEEREEA